MVGSIRAAIYRPIAATSSRARPWQVAFAIATGVLSGLVFMKSPIGILLLGVLFLLPSHLLLAVVTAMLVAGVAWICEPALGQIGGWTLGFSTVSDWVGACNRLPYLPWLRLHNTVVHGGVVVGLFSWIPVFVVTAKFVRTCREEYLQESKHWIRVDGDHAQELSPKVSFSPSNEVAAPKLHIFKEDSADSQEQPVFHELADGARQNKQDSVQTAAQVKSNSEDGDLVESKNATSKDQDADADKQIDTELANELQPMALKLEAVESVGPVEVEQESTKPHTKWQADIEMPVQDASPDPSSEDGAKQENSEAARLLEETIRTAERKLDQAEPAEQLDTAGVASKASELAELVDEMLSAIQSAEVRSALADSQETADSTKESRDPLQSPFSARESESMVSEQDFDPIEQVGTTINEVGEVVNNVEHSEVPCSDSEEHDPSEKSVITHEAHGRSLNGPSATKETVPVSAAKETVPVSADEVAQHEEALRYLLRHLKEIKDRV